MSDINWSGLVNRRNIFSDVSEGLQAGAEMRRDRIKTDREDARHKAYNLFSTDPAAAEAALMTAGDLDGAETLRKRSLATRTDKARASAVEKYGKGDSAGAQRDLMGAGEFDEAKALAGLDNEQRKAAGERAGVMAAYVESLGPLPYDQVKAKIMADAEALSELGYTREQITAFDPTPANLAKLKAQALGLKGVLEQKDREADNSRADQQAAESARHNRTSEGQAATRIGIAKSNSARGWAAHNERVKSKGYGTPGAGGGIVEDDDVEIDP